ncbi:MFS transporter [Gordonia sp. PKS22-38]|uniref:MFS transporter n=2 Tax=Gordonia prachuapensis TaxID=3115651 RepID=A0ABU7MWM0_9ACTN|nr:MFS transporter [Gordonia sp. PKS22-38]
MTLSARRKWAMLGCALIAAMTTTCAVSGVAYLIPALHTEHGVPLSAASILATIPTVGLMILIIPWGVLLDRYGERHVLIISLCVTSVGTIGAVVMSATDAPYWALAVALFIGGLGSGAANGASGRIVVGWFPANQRGTAMGVRQMAQPLGIAVCALTMPLTAASLGVTAALVIPAAVTGLGLVVAVVGIIDPPTAPSSSARPAGTDNPYRTGGFLARVHGVSALLVIPQSMLWTFVPTWLIVAHEWAPAAAGVLVTATQVVGAIGRIVAGRISDAWGSRMRPIRVIAVAASVSVAVLALTDWLDSPVAPIVMAAAAVASVADNGLAFTAIAEFAGPTWSGRGLAIQNTAQYLATAASTPVLGAIIGGVGFPVAFALTAITPLIAVPLVPRDAQRD